MHRSFFTRRPSGMPSIAVALHASANDGRQWTAYRPLLPRGVQLLTPGLIGYRDGPAWQPCAPVSLKDEARSLLPLLRAQPQPVDLVGHSYGGAVAVQAALLWPKLIRSLTVYEPVLFHLLLADARSQRQAIEILSIRQRVCELMAYRRLSEAAELYVSYWGGDAAWNELAPKRQEAVIANMLKVRSEFGALFDARFDVAPLAQAGLPIRLVHGALSPASSVRIAEILAAQLPQAEIVALPQADHAAPMFAPRGLVRHLFSPPAPTPMPMAA